jgi:hypothetical protein
MRVFIYPHDTTDSIITTVKNFYGLYERGGVAFEDRQGTTLIARYENFTHNMVVFVRVMAEEDPGDYSPDPRQSMSPRRARPGESYQMLPPATNHAQVSKAVSRAAQRLSKSPPPGHGRRSTSASANVTKSRPRSLAKSRGSSSHGSFADGHGDGNIYSDSDGGDGSVTSSRRGRKEQVASAEISLDNIVEGGRRKRAKFDSSELPLFVPPQVPLTASISSVSPQRRISNHNGASPFSYTNQHTFAYPGPLPSPQSHGQNDLAYAPCLPTPYSNSSSQATGQHPRTRGSAPYPTRQSGSGGLVFPTPDPTVGSVISDEDVARQLMRLGDASNISSHGRNSTSTLDDAFSGKAEAASSSDESDYASDNEDQGLPPLPYHDPLHIVDGHTAPELGIETSGDEYEDTKDDSFKGDSDEVVTDERHGHPTNINGPRARSVSSKAPKTSKSRAQPKNKIKNSGNGKAPISPASLPQSRKASSASLHPPQSLAPDEEDLSTKPRCQRCRKSKKGCDRQRPCQRCKDAGIGIDGCISEDEGNGRKGRYGRHMGVPVKKTASDLYAVPDHGAPSAANVHPSAFNSVFEKNRKRKR